MRLGSSERVVATSTSRPPPTGRMRPPSPPRRPITTTRSLSSVGDPDGHRATGHELRESPPVGILGRPSTRCSRRAEPADSAGAVRDRRPHRPHHDRSERPADRRRRHPLPVLQAQRGLRSATVQASRRYVTTFARVGHAEPGHRRRPIHGTRLRRVGFDAQFRTEDRPLSVDLTAKRRALRPRRDGHRRRPDAGRMRVAASRRASSCAPSTRSCSPSVPRVTTIPLNELYAPVESGIIGQLQLAPGPRPAGRGRRHHRWWWRRPRGLPRRRVVPDGPDRTRTGGLRVLRGLRRSHVVARLGVGDLDAISRLATDPCSVPVGSAVLRRRLARGRVPRGGLDPRSPSGSSVRR